MVLVKQTTLRNGRIASRMLFTYFLVLRLINTTENFTKNYPPTHLTKSLLLKSDCSDAASCLRSDSCLCNHTFLHSDPLEAAQWFMPHCAAARELWAHSQLHVLSRGKLVKADFNMNAFTVRLKPGCNREKNKKNTRMKMLCIQVSWKVIPNFCHPFREKICLKPVL